MNKNTKLFIITVTLIILFTPLFIDQALAASTPGVTYNWEVGVPGFHPTTAEGGFTNFAKILIKWAFRLAGILAFAMIIFAGFEYTVFSGAPAKQKGALNRIINAVVGLILLFSYWIILNTINPNILKTKESPLPPIPNPSTPNQEDQLYLQNFIQVAKSFSATKKIEYNSSTTPNYPNYQTYLNALKETCGDPLAPDAYKGASCDVYVATVINHSAMGPLLNPNFHYPCYGVDEQWYFVTKVSSDQFDCYEFTDLSQVKPGGILFFNRNGIPGPEHTALKLDDGVYQSSNKQYYPYGPGPSYTTGTACYWKGFYTNQENNFDGGGNGGSGAG